MTETRTTSAQEAFVESLQRLAEAKNRGALAALRRGLGKHPGEAPEMFPYVVPYLPETPSPALESAYYLVASLFAWHPENRSDGNIGNHLLQTIKSDNDRASVERRFVALLNCHVNDLPDLLRQTIGNLKAGKIGINYAGLLSDLLHWSHPDRYVQRNWARGFWGSKAAQSTEETDDASPETTSTIAS